MTNRTLLPISILTFALFACGGEPGADEALDGDETVSADALRTGGVSELTVWQSEGFRPAPPAGGCNPSGRWTVTFATKTLEGSACLGGETVTVNRTLSTDEMKQVKTALSKVRTTSAPQSCPTDVPTRSLSVTRGSALTHYAEARSACGGSIAVTSSSIGALVDRLRTLGTPGPQP